MRPLEAHKNNRQERVGIDSPPHAQSKTKDPLGVSGIPCRSLAVNWFARRVLPIMGYVGVERKEMLANLQLTANGRDFSGRRGASRRATSPHSFVSWKKFFVVTHRPYQSYFCHPLISISSENFSLAKDHSQPHDRLSANRSRTIVCRQGTTWRMSIRISLLICI
jgi:hypothetical protein